MKYIINYLGLGLVLLLALTAPTGAQESAVPARPEEPAVYKSLSCATAPELKEILPLADVEARAKTATGPMSSALQKKVAACSIKTVKSFLYEKIGSVQVGKDVFDVVRLYPVAEAFPLFLMSPGRVLEVPLWVDIEPKNRKELFMFFIAEGEQT